MINWKKRGLIFEPTKHVAWIRSHAWVPTVDVLPDGYCKVYFAGRNKNNYSEVSSFNVNLDDPTRILEVSPEPIVKLGKLGAFDDSAIIPCWIQNIENMKYLYYVGWMQGKRVPYYASLGLAISRNEGETFEKVSTGPLLERNDIDPLFTASACVLVDNSKWRMWYTSNTSWNVANGETRPRYHIKYAESDDGINWTRNGIVAIDFESDDEYAITRPCVRKEGDLYKMWYSYRGEANRIGYAESEDGYAWERLDDSVGIKVSRKGFDSEMIEYAAVIKHKEKYIMFYNGNNYGFDGIALAVEE